VKTPAGVLLLRFILPFGANYDIIQSWIDNYRTKTKGLYNDRESIFKGIWHT